MSEEQSSYKVTDRRLFNADGTPREVPHEEKPAVPVAPPEPVSPSASPLSSEPVAPAPESQQTDSLDKEPMAEEELPDVDDPASFANFMMSIASNAASSLGMMEHPATGKREVDLELGKHWIDILGMLQKKTAGNLLPQEQQILEGLLADLRMQYVSLTNATPAQQPTYTSRDITGG
jgi:Domain of unknown function (DUF1844)